MVVVMASVTRPSYACCALAAPAVVLLNIEGTCCSLDPALLDWFSYNPKVKVKPLERKVELNLELAKAASPLQGNLSQGTCRVDLCITCIGFIENGQHGNV